MIIFFTTITSVDTCKSTLNYYMDKVHRTVIFAIAHTHTHTIFLLLFWNFSGTTRMSRYQKGENQEGKTNLDLLE